MYHELVYHLDLCILAYHLYTQTLIWPMDPYYEQMARRGTDRRTNFMAQVRGSEPIQGYVCPEHLDPIVFDYSRIYPWRPCFVKPQPSQPWLVFQAPDEITEHIATAYMVTEANQNGDRLISQKPGNGGTDRLYCFEGETGLVHNGTGNPPHAGLKSMMGFVLDRQIDQDIHYDIHIAFRGSRSGSGFRAVKEATTAPTRSSHRRGNPDWVTDLDSVGFLEKAFVHDDEISLYGSCGRGFRNCIKTIIPNIMSCLEDIHKSRGENPPRAIYVTGHSLGGALASLFASIVAIGSRYSSVLYDGQNQHPDLRSMPVDLQAWPWESLRLITFGAPGVGGYKFRSGFNSKVYTKRVVLANDPITAKSERSSSRKGTYQIGSFIRIPSTVEDKLPTPDSHKPNRIREDFLSWAATWRDNLIGVPNNEPWKERQSFDTVEDDVTYCGIQASLGDAFEDNLKQYFDMLESTLGSARSFNLLQRRKKENTLNRIGHLIDALFTPHLDDRLTAGIEAWNNQIHNELDDGDLENFLGLCVILYGYNVDPQNMHLQHLRDNAALQNIIRTIL